MTDPQRKPLTLLVGLTIGVSIGLLACFIVRPFVPVQDSLHDFVQSSTQPEFVLNDTYSSTQISVSTLLDIADPSVRRRTLYNSLETIEDERVTNFLRNSLNREEVQRSYPVQKLLFTELTISDPYAALEVLSDVHYSLWEPFLNILAINWSVSKPEDALIAFSTLEEPWKSQAIQGVLQSQKSLSTQELEEIADSLELTNQLSRWHYEAELVNVIDDPRTAFTLTLEAELSDFQKQRYLFEITNQWCEQEIEQDIRSMLGLVFDVFANVWHLWNPIVERISRDDPAEAWDQLLTMPLETQKLFSNAVVATWVESDPVAAVQAITVPKYIASLEPYELLLPLRTWAYAIADNILEYIELVPADYQISVVNDAIEYLAHSSSPTIVLELLEQLRQQGINILEATNVFVKEWSQIDPLASVEWAVQNLDHGPENLQSALQRLTLLDTSKAMEIALAHPEEFGLERSVVGVLLQQGEFDTALSMLPKVRSSPTFPFNYRGTFNNLIPAGRIDDVLDLVEQVPESRRQNFYRNLALSWARLDFESLQERLPKLPSAEVRSIIASNVLREHPSYVYLSEEELGFLESFVTRDTD